MISISAGALDDAVRARAPRETPFDLRIARTPESLTARVEGPLDLVHAPDFLERLQPLLTPTLTRVTIDLTRADYVDSAGVRALLGLRDRVPADGAWSVLLTPGSRVDRTLGLLQLHEQLGAAPGEKNWRERVPNA